MRAVYDYYTRTFFFQVLDALQVQRAGTCHKHLPTVSSCDQYVKQIQTPWEIKSQGYTSLKGWTYERVHNVTILKFRCTK